MRIRTVKPGFFLHDGLFEAEKSSGLPIRIAYIGLWCAADRDGRFAWEPRRLGAVIMPYDGVDFSSVLACLEAGGWVVRYEVDGKAYGEIPSFTLHQVVNNREKPSGIPPRNEELSRVPHACPTRASRDTEISLTRHNNSDHASQQLRPRVTATPTTREGNFQAEGKGREGNMEEEGKKPASPVTPRATAEPDQLPPFKLPPGAPTKAERRAKRKAQWLEDQGVPVDFTVRPGKLQLLSYCKAVHPQWQEAKALEAYDLWALHNWTHDGRKIGNWGALIDAWADNADQSEYGEKIPMGGSVGGIVDAFSADAAGITRGEGIS